MLPSPQSSSASDAGEEGLPAPRLNWVNLRRKLIVAAFIVCVTSLLTTRCAADTSHSTLAFVANLDGNWDLFVVRDDGTNLRRLTSTPYDEKDPAWSPDRTRLVYATSDGKLNVVDVKSGEQQELTIDGQGGAKLSPRFSPDGKDVAFAQFKLGARDDTDLEIFNLETKALRRVVDQYGTQLWPAWSPDGSRLVYSSIHCTSDCGRIIQELWTADPHGAHARQLLLTNSLCQQPVWSPDGRRIAFSSDQSGNFDIWVLNLHDMKLEQITTDESLDVSPAWSPEGDRLVFVSTRSGKMEIWIQDLKSRKAHRLRPFGDKDVECKDVAW